MSEMDHSTDLPDQIIRDEILTRLPVKSLCRFKAVSKLWNVVISSSPFSKAHLNKLFGSNLTSVFFHQGKTWWLLDHEAYDDDEDLAVKSFHFSEDTFTPGGLVSLGKELNACLRGVGVKATPVPVGSSCGLVCFLVYHDNSILLCNPVLRQCQRISTPRPFVELDIILCGFGYVSSSDDFKFVVSLRGQSREDRPMIYVFSLRDHHWRMIQGCDQFHVTTICPIDQHGILLDERLHWWRAPIRHNNDDGCVIAFDLLNEVFNEIPTPKELSYKVRHTVDLRRCSCMSTIGGYLCFSTCGTNDNIEMWILKQYRETDSWVRLYNLCIPIPPNYHQIYLSKCFGFTKSGKFLIWCCIGTFNYHVFLVDPSPSEPNVTMIGNYKGSCMLVHNYVESFVSPLALDEPTLQGRTGNGSGEKGKGIVIQ